MEDAGAIIWLILVVIGVIISSFNKKNKPAQKPQAQQQARPQTGGTAQQSAPARAQTVLRPAAPAQPQTVQPTVSSSLQVTLHDHEGMFQGSLNADDSGEGRDIQDHDHGFTHEVEMPSMHSAETINDSLTADGTPAGNSGAGFRLPLSAEGLVQSLVMQEVLRRPCQRR